MIRLNLTDARCEALFASSLQPSDSPTPAVLAEAISRTVRQIGIQGCASRMAQEFGDHPEAARDRMRWIRQLAGPASDCPARPCGGRRPAGGVRDRSDAAGAARGREDPLYRDVRHPS